MIFISLFDTIFEFHLLEPSKHFKNISFKFSIFVWQYMEYLKAEYTLEIFDNKVATEKLNKNILSLTSTPFEGHRQECSRN